MGRPPLRVGMLHDFPRPDGGASFEWAVRLGLGEVAVTGRGPAPVVFVHEAAHGGPDHALAPAFARLVGGGVLAILGPALSDGALAVRSLADAARIPCINYAGNELARGPYLFHFQLGSLEDEPALVVDDLVRRGFGRVALIQDTSSVGERLAAFFGEAAAAAGREIVVHARVAPDAAGVAAAVASARRAAPDAVVCLGFWRAAHAVALEMRAQEWRVPAVANSALMYGHADPVWAGDWEGWTYADTFSERNPRFAALSRMAAAAGRPAGPGEAGAYDLGRLLGEGIARAPEPTREGVRAGLERVKAVPAASGHAGTRMGFGHWDRGALKGPYLVLREWRAGRSVEHPEIGP
jgi:ABC-type branched-subunit amino acid transport system substrate-binding protein